MSGEEPRRFDGFSPATIKILFGDRDPLAVARRAGVPAQGVLGLLERGRAMGFNDMLKLSRALCVPILSFYLSPGAAARSFLENRSVMPDSLSRLECPDCGAKMSLVVDSAADAPGAVLWALSEFGPDLPRRVMISEAAVTTKAWKCGVCKTTSTLTTTHNGFCGADADSWGAKLQDPRPAINALHPTSRGGVAQALLCLGSTNPGGRGWAAACAICANLAEGEGSHEFFEKYNAWESPSPGFDALADPEAEDWLACAKNPHALHDVLAEMAGELEGRETEVV